MKITDDIGISKDVSILAAIASGEGTALFIACVGNCAWAPGQLDGEMSGEMPWHQNTSWLDTPASIESVFNLTEEEQWQRAIEIVAHDKVSSWL
jgi:putative AlgH/UPF0301 family transcriptional regulator